MEIDSLQWNKNTLSGISNLPSNFLYTLYLHEADNVQYKAFRCAGAKLIATTVHGNMRQITLKTTQSGRIHWTVSYR